MGNKKQENKSDEVLTEFKKAYLNADIQDSLVKKLKQRLDGFRQELQFHPFVINQERRKTLKWKRILPRPLILAWPSLLVITVLISVTIGMSFFGGKSALSWAEVNKRFSSVPFYSCSYYYRDVGFFDSPKLNSFSDRTQQSSSNYDDNKIQIEYWIGYGNRIRIIHGRTVTFAQKGGFIKTFDLDTRKESTPYPFTVILLSQLGYIGDSEMNPSSFGYILNALFLYKFKNTATFVNSYTTIAKDLIIFDMESSEGAAGHWKYRFWVLRSSKLPIRMLGQSLAGGRVDLVFSYSQEQPKDFFNPDIFEAELKDTRNSVHSLMYMGLERMAINPFRFNEVIY
jgi:hypothetical protein